MANVKSTRRQFLKSGAALATAGAMLSAPAPTYAAPTRGPKLRLTRQRRALVFIMLDGGNDSFNMLVPTSRRHYADYKRSRSNLALEQRQLLPLSGNADGDGRTFGLHPSMPEVQHMFDRGDLSFVANIGPMISPVSKQSVTSGAAQLPLGLLSHADQFKHWQTSRPDQRTNNGWFGYFADALQQNRPVHQIPMGISMAGSNIMQNGAASTTYSITEKGSVGLVVNAEPSPLNNALLKSFEGLLRTQYPDDPFCQTYLSITREAQAQHEIFRTATSDIRVPVRFPDTPLAQQLKKVAQTIKAADRLKQPQQTFFLRYIGWDHHDELLRNHAKMLKILSQALGAFQASLDRMGLADSVVTFTGSDFGRTLTSNGNGTDHGWGGNTIVMGKPVAGGQVFGKYPDLTLAHENPLDMGDGVLIPTTATDQLYAELATWFGADRQDIPRLFPNIGNFVTRPDQPSLGVIG